jgi:hydrogenase-1 operon protein HyaF
MPQAARAHAYRPLPIVRGGPEQHADLDAPSQLHLPITMPTYRAPILPEPAELAPLSAAIELLQTLHRALLCVAQGGAAETISLAGLGRAELDLIAQVLGEGELSAVVRPREPGAASLHVQEAALTGVFRVVELASSGVVSDRLEVTALPSAVLERAASDGRVRGAELASAAASEGLMNAPALLSELRAHWQSAPQHTNAHVINLTLLPLSEADARCLDAELGRGTVTLLSRGYGNCRISSTERPATWRVTYYNSEDTVILDTIEVSRVPEVACAAREDLAESGVRLAELLAWLEGP